jgi:hypothetical protein
LVLLGFGLAALGVIGYVVQFRAGRLWAPWYIPILATLSALCTVVALLRARSLWRVLALVVLVLFAGLTWAFLLGRLPRYEGPVAEGTPFPAFATVKADGTSPFTQRDLEGDRDNLLVFFRGRW